MTPSHQILVGDCIDMMRTFPDKSVQCCVTSPPYFGLRDYGWYLRQDTIWHKPNPMPESVNDRCTKAHEYIFLLSKSQQYYYDQSAILEPCSPNTHNRLPQDVLAQIDSDRANGGTKSNGNMKAVARKFNGVGWGHGTDGEDLQCLQQSICS